MTTKEELIAFGVTEYTCQKKVKEHRQDIERAINKIHIATAFADLAEGKQKIIWNIVVKNKQDEIDMYNREINKWVHFAKMLRGDFIDPDTITEDDKQRAKERDIVSIISQDIELKKRGAYYWGKCPFHDDQHASMYIKNNTYFCFVCHATGDTIGWLVKYRNMKFPEAVRELR